MDTAETVPTGRRRTPQRVSVVIPVRDAAPTLGRQLALLADERLDIPWEVVVADNGSTDGSPEVARAHAHRFAALRVIDASARRGPAHARNEGARVATGDLLCFCDADDEIDPGWLPALVAAAAHHHVVAGRLDVDTINSALTRGWRPRPVPARTAAPAWAASSNMAVWADAFAEVGGFDEDLRADEDVELSRRLLAAGGDLAWAPDAVVHYRLRASAGALLRQSFRSAWWGVHARDRHGEPRTRPVAALARHAGWLVVRVPYLAVPRRRGLWAHRLGTLAGELGAAGWLLLEPVRHVGNRVTRRPPDRGHRP